MHLNDPIYENGTHLFVDVALMAHVVLIGQVVLLTRKEILDDLVSVLGHVVLTA